MFDLSHDEIVRSDYDEHGNEKAKDCENGIVEPLQFVLSFAAHAQCVVVYVATVVARKRLDHILTIALAFESPFDQTKFASFFVLTED